MPESPITKSVLREKLSGMGSRRRGSRGKWHSYRAKLLRSWAAQRPPMQVMTQIER